MISDFSIANLYTVFEDILTNVQSADVLDIFIVASAIYLGLMLFKRAKSIFLFNGLLVLVVIYITAKVFNLYLTSYFFQFFLTSFVIILAIVFQKEIRTFFEIISAPERFKRMLGIRVRSVTESAIDVVIKATGYFALNKIGALMVLPRSQPVEAIVEGGVELGGKISLSLLLSIFDSSSPGHDGAVIIERGSLTKFGVHLPLAERFMKFGELGTRHRAALGLAGACDALVIVVSEENGGISVAQNGDLLKLPGTGELRDLLREFVKEKSSYTTRKFWKDLLVKNIFEKALAFSLACVLWFFLAFQPGITTRNFDVSPELRSLSKEVIVNQMDPETVKITLSGSTQEFKILSEDSLKITIDATDFVAGENYVEITQEDISYPSSLTMTDFTPMVVVVKTKPRVTPTPVPTIEPEQVASSTETL